MLYELDQLRQEALMAKGLIQGLVQERNKAEAECVELRKEVQELKADREASLDFAAETGIVIGDLKQQLALAKKIAGGFSSALMTAESKQDV